MSAPPPLPTPAPGSAAETVAFELADIGPDRLLGVRLWQEVRLPGDLLNFAGHDGRWTLSVPRPPVDRMEYLFEVTRADGSTETFCDPGNPRRVGGAFGDHSVREFPEYRAPAWLGGDWSSAHDGTYAELEIDAPGLTAAVTGSLWTPPGLDPQEPAGLVVVHDGPEYDHLAAFTRYLTVMIAAGTVPPVRAALLAPGPRDDWYSASPAYAQALTAAVLPHLRARVPVTALVGVGASLGALEMLIAHRRSPGSFDGLFLQSGSFFQRGRDDQERRFAEFDRIARTVAGVLASAGTRNPVPTVLTCGGIEENLGNNRDLRRALAAQGYPVVLRELRDVHNYTAWRDALDPDLTGLLRRVIPAAGAEPRPDGEPQPDGQPQPPEGDTAVTDAWIEDPHGGFAGHVRSYGHWGRPVLGFPAEAGSAGDFEANGMVGALSPLLDAGRIKLYCVDSDDASTWSNHSLSLEERARRHDGYERWIVDGVVPHIAADSGGRRDIVTVGTSLGAFHAVNIALRRADIFGVGVGLSGNYDPSLWNGWGGHGDASYFHNPVEYVANLGGDHLDWLRGHLHLVLVVGQGAFEEQPTRSQSGTRQLAHLLAGKQISHDLDVWGHDVPHDWSSWQRQAAHHLPRFC